MNNENKTKKKKIDVFKVFLRYNILKMIIDKNKVI